MKKTSMKRYILSEKREISKLCCNFFKRFKKKKKIHFEPELMDLFLGIFVVIFKPGK